MTYILEIKETPKSKALIEHLKTLNYVKVRREPLSEEEIIKQVRKSERGKPIKWADAQKQMEAWK